MRDMKVDMMLKDLEPCHSTYQMVNFIVGRSGTTDYARYIQCLRELRSRYTNLRKLRIRKQGLSIERDMMVKDVNKHDTGSSEFQLGQLRIEAWDLSREGFDETISEAEREYEHFRVMAVALKKSVGDLTPEKRLELERRVWIDRVKIAAGLDLLSVGIVTKQTFDLALSLARDDRIALFQELKIENRPALLAWFESQDFGWKHQLDLPAMSQKALTDGSDHAALGPRIAV